MYQYESHYMDGEACGSCEFDSVFEALAQAYSDSVPGCDYVALYDPDGQLIYEYGPF